MIVKGFRRTDVAEDVQPAGFDDFDLRLGDLMRGERATMGKSLLDVQRELKIKAAYIAAIENADPSAFDTPGFIAGYVRSYARYLNMDPEWAFEKFCNESGFVTAHGMSAEASSNKRKNEAIAVNPPGKDIFAAPATPFIPTGEARFSTIEPSAIGSLAVLAVLVCGLGYGGWSVLQEVQKVQLAPVEQTPQVISSLDPLAGGAGILEPEEDRLALNAPSTDALDRLYRPQPLDVPVLVARDAPISTLNPGSFGVIEPITGVDAALAEAVANPVEPTPIQVNETPVPEVQLVAVRPAWVRVRSADGTIIFEGTMNAGDTFALPQTEEPATLRVGESGAMYFAVNGEHFGPAGPQGTLTKNLPLDSESLVAAYEPADLDRDDDLAEIIRLAQLAVSE
ncbi:protein RodZ, contains Xre-like HTH and DUF4115 domains [Cognatiyoonia sediminum]|uniref:Protein RodZ, contains Xre-like HTH and DUF4115 domains n=1 Tax=Cognatiyoonia sediminum TaxID=1508389 RepID=A0A1M5LJ64_9RHOB|nr:helix-turn-helix domain-containing protein [Cognatiyoonia sediminum]SHG65184.1 protein RodZ, contains Xre-like HTH and DUF4115 domains [Cognatiyoonia sediminum]